MPDQLLADLSRFTPEVALTLTFLAGIVAELFVRRTSLVVAGIVLAGFLLTGLFVLGQGGMSASLFSGMITVDPFAVFFKLVIVLSAIFVLVFSLHSGELNTPGRGLGEYYFLLPALTLGLVLMAGASNMLMIYLAVELSSISSYILAGYTKDAPDSSEAALKYVIYGALSSGLMLYGMSLIYGLTGSLDLADINAALPGVLEQSGGSPYLLLIAGLLVLAGFGYKISAVPFHFWAPDVYEGAPITITAFLAVASKAAGFAVLVRFFKVTFIDTSAVGLAPGTWAVLRDVPWVEIIAVLAVVTMTIGNLIAIWQNNMKRLLAYSSIAHAGYMLTGVVVLNNEGLAAVLLYFVVYLFMNLGAFYAVMLIANETGSEDIEDYRALGPRAPVLTVALTIFLISLTGLPPTAGFIGKLYLFAALINGGWAWLALVGALNSVIALYYYARVIRNMYLRSSEEAAAPLRFGGMQTAVVMVLLVPTLLFGLYFTPLAELAQASVRMFGAP
jgi:NADH-quinone oxidoreductase subunit N